MSDHGLKISVEETDVISLLNTKDFLFNSNFNSLKIIKRGKFTYEVATSGGPFTFSVDHKLGYRPAFLAYASFSHNANGARIYTPFGDALPELARPLAANFKWIPRIDEQKIQFISGADTIASYSVTAYYILFSNVMDKTFGSEVYPSNDNIGFKSSLLGSDAVAKSTKLSYHSSLDILEVAQIKTGQLSSIAGTQDITIKHGLGFKPMFLMYWDGNFGADTQGRFRLIPFKSAAGFIVARVDEQNIYIYISSAAAERWKYKIFFFRNRIE